MSTIIATAVAEMKDIKSAIHGAFATRGKNKGQLLAKCPPVDTPEAAAWLAFMSIANPYKVGMGHMLFMGNENRELYDLIRKAIKETKMDVRSLDRDRKVLETIGAW